MTTKKNYYEVLGVSKGADSGEIKKAYRNLALETHPDRHPDDKEAEAKFKEISEAYGVLSDPQKKASYDRFGLRERRPPGFDTMDVDSLFAEEFLRRYGGFSNNKPKDAPVRGRDVSMEFPVRLSSAVLGGKEKLEVSFPDNCPSCLGVGGFVKEACTHCSGRGVILNQVRNGNSMVSSVMPCQQCKGIGTFLIDGCLKCKASGRVTSSKSLVVTVPPRIKLGSKIALRGQGQVGFNGGKPGDIVLFLSIKYPELTEEQQELLRSFDAG
jgi:molecular chaperone DnaJ